MIANIDFYKIIQDSQEIGSDDSHMVSRIFFRLQIYDQNYFDLNVDVKQTVGSDYETAPLEVGAPRGYKGPFNHEAFQREVEQYYRESFGADGSVVSFSGGSIRMFNNTMLRNKHVEFEVET
jgi:hypothetical protein